MEAEPMVDRFAVRMDPGVIYQYSPLAAHVSDGLVVVEMVAPVIFLGVEASRAQFSNASLIHAEALSINLALNGLMKYAVRRPRPYTYNPERAIRERYDCSRTTDACLSFYSGHSSTAFAAAFSGVLLTNETVAMSAGYRALWWGVMLGGASATAQLRVRAGKHFYSDVVVGALVGSAIGIMVPRIHGSRYTPELAEVGAGSAGLVVGALLPLLVPSDELPNELSLSVGISGAPGLALSGRW
jgi:membrane-associated phospholipid phosphatase